MSYSVELTKLAERKFEKLPDTVAETILKKLEGLSTNPRPPGCQKLVDTHPPGWRIRVGKHRVLYLIDDDAHIVRVYDIDLRDKSYKKKR